MLDGNYTQRQDVTRKCALAAKRRGHQVFAVMADGQCASGPNTDKNFVKFGYSKTECSTMAVSNNVYILGYYNIDGRINEVLCFNLILKSHVNPSDPKSCKPVKSQQTTRQPNFNSKIKSRRNVKADSRLLHF